MIDRDDWSELELAEGDSYATTCVRALEHILVDLRTLKVMLPEDKRVIVELTALLDLAAQLAQGKLQLDTDDFAMTALAVFMRSRD